MSQFHSETFKKHLPPYLTEDRKDGLVKELARFPYISSYYLGKSYFKNEILQGDIVVDMEMYKYNNQTTIKTHGIILSNSCDIDENNDRYKEVFATFCPIISLDKFKKFVETEGKDFKSIEDDIKKQRLTDIFYLPQESYLPCDYIALLSQATSIPYSLLNKNNKRHSLSQVGFYLFLFKLSVHYCRFHEGVQRY
jgi:hypothetical protein